MARSQEMVTIEDCEIKAKTLHAVLVIYDEQEEWIPLSLIHGAPMVGDASVTVAAWKAKAIGFI